MPDQLLQKIINVGGHTYRYICPLPLGAPIFKFHAIDASHIVDVNIVTIHNRTISDLHFRIIGRQKFVNLSLKHFISYFYHLGRNL